MAMEIKIAVFFVLLIVANCVVTEAKEATKKCTKDIDCIPQCPEGYYGKCDAQGLCHCFYVVKEQNQANGGAAANQCRKDSDCIGQCSGCKFASCEKGICICTC